MDSEEEEFILEEQEQSKLFNDIEIGLLHLYDDNAGSRYAERLDEIAKYTFYAYLDHLSPKKIAEMELATYQWSAYFSGFTHDQPEQLVKAAILADNLELLNFLYEEPQTERILSDPQSIYYTIKIDLNALNREAELLYKKEEERVNFAATQVKKILQAALPSNGQVSFFLVGWLYAKDLELPLLKQGIVPHHLQMSRKGSSSHGLLFYLRLLHSGMQEKELEAWTQLVPESGSFTSYLSTSRSLGSIGVLWTLYSPAKTLQFMHKETVEYLLYLAPDLVTPTGNILPPKHFPFKKYPKLAQSHFAVTKSDYRNGHASRLYFLESQSPLVLTYESVYHCYNLYEALLFFSGKVSSSKGVVMLALAEIIINHRYLIRQYWNNYKQDLKYTLLEAYYFFGLSISQPSEEWKEKVYLGNLVQEKDALKEQVVQNALQAAGQELGYDLVFIENFIGPLQAVSAIYDCRTHHEQYLYKK